MKYGKTFRICLLLLPFIVSCTSQEPIERTRPNIILILADDLGYNDVGFNGSTEISTPNIDRIAENGVTFTNGYVSYAVCGPSRAGLITGRYQDRFGFSRNPLFAPKDIDQGLPLEEQTMAEALAAEGYKNMAIGKWHLGAHPDLRPLQRGFHEFFGFLSGGHNYLPAEWDLHDISDVKAQYDPYRTKLLRNDQRIEEEEYLTDALSREAVNYIKHNSNQPFFLYLAYNAPHGPLQATDKYLRRYSHIKDERRKTYAAMVSAMDDGIGSVLNELENLNLLDNTLVIFLSDNGGRESLGADNGLLNRGKGSLFEGGIRVPFAIQWPGNIPSGIIYDRPVISLDIFATIQGITGMPVKNKLDGTNLLPFIKGNKTGSPHDYLYWRKFDQQGIAIRGAQYKLVHEDGKVGLFDLQGDISEQNPLDITDTTAALHARFRAWDRQNLDPVFLGLMQDKQYSKENPDRFKDIEKY